MANPECSPARRRMPRRLLAALLIALACMGGPLALPGCSAPAGQPTETASSAAAASSGSADSQEPDGSGDGEGKDSTTQPSKAAPVETTSNRGNSEDLAAHEMPSHED